MRKASLALDLCRGETAGPSYDETVDFPWYVASGREVEVHWPGVGPRGCRAPRDNRRKGCEGNRAESYPFEPFSSVHASSPPSRVVRDGVHPTFARQRVSLPQECSGNSFFSGCASARPLGGRTRSQVGRPAIGKLEKPGCENISMHGKTGQPG